MKSAPAKRLLKLFLVLLPALAIILGDITVSHAQERRSLFDRIFGRKEPPAAAQPAPRVRRVYRPRKRVKPRAHPQGQTAQPARQAAPAKPQIVKSQHAKRVLVLGDFVAGAMAEGLTEAYDDNPDVVIIKRSEGSSGIVRNDYYNWPDKAIEIINKEKPDIVLLMLGANDRQTMKFDDRSLEYGIPEWNAYYQIRLDTLASRLSQTDIPWVWFSLPSFKKPQLNQSIIVLNSYYKAAATKAGGRFIDVWDGFVDDNGNFALSGYDANGQTARLRTNDGVNFTVAGRRKLAFYAEGALQDLLTGIDTGGAPKEATPVIGALPRNIERVAPMGLWDGAKQNTSLLGASISTDDAKTDKEEPWQPRNGTHAGRADNFALPVSDKQDQPDKKHQASKTISQ